MPGPLYPHVEVQLTGPAGSPSEIARQVAGGMRRAGVRSEEIVKFTDEVINGGRDNVLKTVMRWVTLVCLPPVRPHRMLTLV